MASQKSIASLPKDLYSKIMSNSDSKSIAVCTSVSKSWNDILSNTEFSKLYSQKRPLITGFFYQSSINYPEKLQYVPVSPHEEYVSDPPACLGFLDSPAILKNSCNGLLLWLVNRNKLVISNPLTQKFIPLDWTFHFVKNFACGVAFDPSISDHFKVILLVKESAGCFKSRVFSSEGMKWGEGIETQVPFNKAKPYSNYKGVFLNGIIYWELMNHSLYAYNASDNVSCLIGLPVLEKNTKNSLSQGQPGCLGEAKGSLHYCRVLDTVLNVWESEQLPLISSATWDLKYRIDLCSVTNMYPEMNFLGSQALAFVDDCHAILMSTKHEIIEFSFANDNVQKHYRAQIDIPGRNVTGAHHVDPSLFFPFKHSLALFNIHKKTQAVQSVQSVQSDE